MPGSNGHSSMQDVLGNSNMTNTAGTASTTSTSSTTNSINTAGITNATASSTTSGSSHVNPDSPAGFDNLAEPAAKHVKHHANNHDGHACKGIFGGGSDSTPDTGNHGDGLGWFAQHWKEIAIVAGSIALIALIAKMIKSLDSNIKIRFQRCANVLQRMQKDFTLAKDGLNMKAVLPGIGSRIMDKIARLWTGMFKRKSNKANEGAIGLHPFCRTYISEIESDFQLAQDAFNKIRAAKDSEDSITSTPAKESNVKVYKSFREAYLYSNLNESEQLNESALLGVVPLASLMITAGKFVWNFFKNGKPVPGSGKAVQVTKESTREICYSIIYNFLNKYISMNTVMSRIGISSKDLADLDMSSCDKLKKILEQYGNKADKMHSAQFVRLQTAYNKMLTHYFKIGNGLITNFKNNTKAEDEKHQNLLIAAEEKLLAMWDKQKDIYTNNFSHVLIEIIKSDAYINYLNFIIESVLPVFKTGLAGDADYILDVMPKKGEKYLIRQTNNQSQLSDGEALQGNAAVAEITEFNNQSKNISFKILGGLERTAKIEYLDDGKVSLKSSDLNPDIYKGKENVEAIAFGKWLALDPHLVNFADKGQDTEDSSTDTDTKQDTDNDRTSTKDDQTNSDKKYTDLYIKEINNKNVYIIGCFGAAQENLEHPEIKGTALNEDDVLNELSFKGIKNAIDNIRSKGNNTSGTNSSTNSNSSSSSSTDSGSSQSSDSGTNSSTNSNSSSSSSTDSGSSQSNTSSTSSADNSKITRFVICTINKDVTLDNIQNPLFIYYDIQEVLINTPITESDFIDYMKTNSFNQADDTDKKSAEWIIRRNKENSQTHESLLLEKIIKSVTINKIDDLQQTLDTLSQRQFDVDKLADPNIQSNIAKEIIDAVNRMTNGLTPSANTFEYDKIYQYNNNDISGWKVKSDAISDQKRFQADSEYNTPIKCDRTDAAFKFHLVPTLIDTQDNRILSQNVVPDDKNSVIGVKIFVENPTKISGDALNDIQYTCRLAGNDIMQFLSKFRTALITEKPFSDEKSRETSSDAVDTYPKTLYGMIQTAKDGTYYFNEKNLVTDENDVKAYYKIRLYDKNNGLFIINSSHEADVLRDNKDLLMKLDHTLQPKSNISGIRSVTAGKLVRMGAAGYMIDLKNNPPKFEFIVNDQGGQGTQPGNTTNTQGQQNNNQNSTTTSNNGNNINGQNNNGQQPNASANNTSTSNNTASNNQNNVTAESLNINAIYNTSLQESNNTVIVNRTLTGNISKNAYILTESVWNDGSHINIISDINRRKNIVYRFKTYEQLASYAKKYDNVYLKKYRTNDTYTVHAPKNLYGMLTEGNQLYESIYIINTDNQNNIISIINCNPFKIEK